jgi:hypothetical protein
MRHFIRYRHSPEAELLQPLSLLLELLVLNKAHGMGAGAGAGALSLKPHATKNPVC